MGSRPGMSGADSPGVNDAAAELDVHFADEYYFCGGTGVKGQNRLYHRKHGFPQAVKLP